MRDRGARQTADGIEQDWLGRPIETALLTRIPGGRRLAKHVELGGAGLGIVLLADQSRRYQSRWTEYEAWWLTYGAEPAAP